MSKAKDFIEKKKLAAAAKKQEDQSKILVSYFYTLSNVPFIISACYLPKLCVY